MKKNKTELRCYECNKKLKNEVIKLDIGQGDTFYLHKQCLEKWIDKHSKVVKIEVENK